MKEEWSSDNAAPEAQAASEDERLPRGRLIPRWFKAMVVASPVFGISLGLNWNFSHALAFAAISHRPVCHWSILLREVADLP